MRESSEREQQGAWEKKVKVGRLAVIGAALNAGHGGEQGRVQEQERGSYPWI